MNQRKRRSSVFSMVGAAALSLLLVGPAIAADETTATVTGGTLTITNAVADDFVTMSVTGADQVTFAGLAAYTVSDLRGSGAGWHVTAQATQFDGGAHDLALGSLLMAAPTVSSPDTTSPDPTVVTGNHVLDAVTAVSFSSAALDTGMGNYIYSASVLVLLLPADVYAGTYTSTLTVSVITAPS